MNTSNNPSVHSLSMMRNDSWSFEKLPLSSSSSSSSSNSKKRPCSTASAVLGAFKNNKKTAMTPFSIEDGPASFSLEPTPIATSGITVVNRYDVAESGLTGQAGGYFRSCLSSLLQQQLQQRAMCPSVSFTGMEVAKPPQGMVPPVKQHQQKQQGMLPTLISSDDLARNHARSSSHNTSNRSSHEGGGAPHRESHLEKWSQRFRDLVDFRKSFGHCLVPLEFPENPSLAHWVKRQRCQYKAKMEGRHSTLSSERQAALEDLGFIWDSHKATWEERLNEIIRFKATHGHTNIPSKYEHNPQLSIWVKCQRRQYKLFLENKKSNMTSERAQRLTDIAFDWAPRRRKTTSSSGCDNSSISSDLF